MLSIPCQTALWQTAYRDPELGRLFDDELRMEQARHANWQRDAERVRGVHIAGLEPEPFAAKSAQQLFEAAQLKLQQARDFRLTDEGQFVAAIAEIEKLSAAIHGLAGEARAARSRGFGNPANLRRCEDVMAQIIVATDSLRQRAIDGELAAGNAAMKRAAA